MFKRSGVLGLYDEDYPSNLKQIYNPPQQLFYRGNIELLQKTNISIVGTRKNSRYGKEITEKIIEDLSVLDICIVSGLAKGIDTIAHKTALELNIPTIAVLGSGIDYVYPKQNKRLADEIHAKGLIISEYPELSPPLPLNFPQRNRIVSGISVATIVIEAPTRSGTLITAKLALDQGREIFVVPGDVDRENSIGCINLLQTGAAFPIKSGKDVIKVLKRQPHLFRTQQKLFINNGKENIKKSSKNLKKMQIELNLDPKEKKVFNAINKKVPSSIHHLKNKIKIEVSELLSILSILEIQGLISSKNGGYIQNY